jgi:hypothetical protein
MVYRTRINYTAAQKTEMWTRWQRGESLNAIGRVFDRPSSSINFTIGYEFCRLFLSICGEVRNCVLRCQVTE